MNCIKLYTKNDRNGNPRRVFVFLRPSGTIAFAVDEGYKGRGAVSPEYIPNSAEISEFQTTPTEYRSILKLWGKEV